MKRLVLALGMICTIFSGLVRSETDRFSKTEVVDGEPLTLCGTALVKAYGLFKVANSGLYRSDCNLAWNLNDPNERRLIKFVYLREVPAHAFSEAANQLLRRNLRLTDTQWEALEDFNAAYLPVQDGDIYQLTYQPESGLKLILNDRLVAQTGITDWASSYYAIWLGADPFSDRMKQSLLGAGANR